MKYSLIKNQSRWYSFYKELAALAMLIDRVAVAAECEEI